MIKVDHISTMNFEGAIRGMRNPLDSWHKSDSIFTLDEVEIGPNDLSLMRKLYHAGPEHRKYLRQIFVSMDVTAPLYFWKEAETYKVGTVTNSCSTMHTIHKNEFSWQDFSYQELIGSTWDEAKEYKGILPKEAFIVIINTLNETRQLYLKAMDERDAKSARRYWYSLIQLLPSSYNQKRTWTMNYENVLSIIHQRSGHKLMEWNQFVDILKKLPYIEEITAV